MIRSDVLPSLASLYCNEMMASNKYSASPNRDTLLLSIRGGRCHPSMPKLHSRRSYDGLLPPASLKPLFKPPGPDSCTPDNHHAFASSEPQSRRSSPDDPKAFRGIMARMHSSHKCIRLDACMRSFDASICLCMHACMHSLWPPCKPAHAALIKLSMQKSAFIAGARAMPVMQAQRPKTCSPG